MKKKYNAPEIGIIRIDNNIMQAAISGGDYGENGAHGDSRHNRVNFIDYDDEDDI